MPAHTALSAQQFLAKNVMTPMPHPPYSPNLPHNSLFLFPWMTKVLQEKCFADVEEMKQKTAEALKASKMDKFKNCFEQWRNVWISVLYQMQRTLKATKV